jgi:DNA-binding transcriptional MerR regulator
VVIANTSDRAIWIDEAALARIEKHHAAGISSAGILEVFAAHGIALSEATLRKYVQHGLLPRSVRVGRKGKHQGSQGLYPVGVIRQILRIKRMMADDYTLEQIKRDVFFMRSDLQQLEATLHAIFSTLARLLKSRKGEAHTRGVARDVEEAKHIGRELVARLVAIESRLAEAPELQQLSAS